MQRRKNLLIKEKQAIDENLLDMDNESNKFKIQLNNLQGGSIACENEKKHLESLLQKVKLENGKLLEELTEFSRVDDKVKRMMNRNERAKDIKDLAEVQLKAAAA